MNRPPTLAEVDRSFRTVAVFLVAKAVCWVVLGTLAMLLASVKLHAPGMMSGSAWLTYGRLWPAGWDMFVYGFAGQIGFGIGLWILGRTCLQRLQAPAMVLGGGVLWNLGILAGVIGILTGHSTGREWLEMPAPAMAIMILGAALIGVAGWLTFAARTIDSTYPSAWFVLLALLACVWSGSLALLMYDGNGARGVVQVLVQRWFATGMLKLWLGALGLAVVLQALPRLVNRPLASRQLALWGFWALVFFGPWTIAHHGDPFPRWVIALSMAGRALGMIAVVCLAVNLWKTTERAWGQLFSTLPGKLLGTAALCQVAGWTLDYLVALPWPSSWLRLTWMQQGLEWLLVGGAVVCALVAVLPDFLARATGRALAPGWVGVHAWLTLVGLALITLPLLLAGVVQGAGLAGGTKTFLEALGSSMHGVRLSTLGFTLLFAGQLALAAALAGWLRGAWTECLDAAKAWAGLARTEEARP